MNGPIDWKFNCTPSSSNLNIFLYLFVVIYENYASGNNAAGSINQKLLETDYIYVSSNQSIDLRQKTLTACLFSWGRESRRIRPTTGPDGRQNAAAAVPPEYGLLLVRWPDR